jgi:hypothetical protein
MLALSVRQPWAWLIIHGGKNVENRTWRTEHRGPLLIHAAKTRDTGYVPVGVPDELLTGGIVGVVELVDVVDDHDSPWSAPGHVHWVLENPRPLQFLPCRGRQHLFAVDYPPRVRCGSSNPERTSF